ncbi:MAG TPA: GNAT family N-acetyltransferase [Vicinamibacteria bacterium]
METPAPERASPDDAADIARLHLASWRATYAAELSPAYLERQDAEDHAARWRQRLDEGAVVLVARAAAHLVGFVAAGQGPGAAEWEIFNLHVDPGRHRRGLGLRLFEAALELARQGGARELVLWVVETNRGARAFYERQGMRPDGAAQDHVLAPGEVLHEVRYRLRL